MILAFTFVLMIVWLAALTYRLKPVLATIRQQQDKRDD